MVPSTKFDNTVIGKKQKFWLQIHSALARQIYACQNSSKHNFIVSHSKHCLQGAF